jgi:hypothetical protein
MKMTNKFNLPKALMVIANDDHVPKEKKYSTTTIMGGFCEMLLTRRHYDEIEIDVSDMMPAIIGTAIHDSLERADNTKYSELSLEHEIMDGYILTGRIDLYVPETNTIEDYKTTGVWKIINQDFGDWERQGLVYAWLAFKNGFFVSDLRFHAILKDWSKAEFNRRGEPYPSQAIYTWHHSVTSTDLKRIEEYIKERFQNIIHLEGVPDEKLPECTLFERWNPGNKYAVMRNGRKTAVKIYDDFEEASSSLLSTDYIETREGYDRKCNEYCNVNRFCIYWRRKNWK